MEKIKKTNSIGRETISHVIGYIIAAFGLIAGLAWNDFAKSVIEYIFPVKADGILAKAIYAILITLFVILVTAYLSKMASSKDEKK